MSVFAVSGLDLENIQKNWKMRSAKRAQECSQSSISHQTRRKTNSGEHFWISRETVVRARSHMKSRNLIRRRMARERRGAESSVVSMETLYYKTIY